MDNTSTKKREFYLGNLEALLCGLLDCDAAELEVFSETRYDLMEVVKRVIEDGNKPSIDSLITMVVMWGIIDLQAAIDRKMDEIAKQKTCSRPGEYSPLSNVYTILFGLDPTEDVEFKVNSIDVTICFKYNEDIYRKYLSEDIEKIEKQMGFPFC